MAVVPGDELRGGPRSRQVFAGDAHAPVGLGSDGIDNRVVVVEQLVVTHVAAHLEVAEEAKARLHGDLLERARDGLDLRMIRSDAEPHEAPRGRKPLDHVDFRGGGQERARRVEAGRTGADDCDTQRILGCSSFRFHGAEHSNGP